MRPLVRREEAMPADRLECIGEQEKDSGHADQLQVGVGERPPGRGEVARGHDGQDDRHDRVRNIEEEPHVPRGSYPFERFHAPGIGVTSLPLDPEKGEALLAGPREGNEAREGVHQQRGRRGARLSFTSTP
jgi:hypothetical protein